MTLTLSNGPLSPTPPETVNYELVGPAHKLLMSGFPRRLRAEIGGVTIFDTVDATLLHETAILPAVYVPIGDVDTSLLERSDHTTHCPFKGDASYWSIRVGDRVEENAVWGYERPNDDAEFLTGRVAVYWDRLDRWFDEDEEVFGHVRDPYHRVDVRSSSRPVTVDVAGRRIASSNRAMVVSETGLANRWYVPRDDVDMAALSRSSTASHCPYKGDATWWNLTATDDGEGRDDVAWSYDDPFDDTARIAGFLSFDGDDVIVDVGRRSAD